MEQRIDKKTGQKVSLLGFGTMRLPRVDPDRQQIDRPAAQALIDQAMAGGVNYYDTAYYYHDGDSEDFLGQALAAYPRDSYLLASKMPAFDEKVNTPADAKEVLEHQLARLRTGYLDFYLCHSVGGAESFRKLYLESGILEYLKEEQQAGRICRLGFSYHGPAAELDRLLDCHPWDFVQLQLNYLDWELQQARQQYESARRRGIPCMVMEPVRGGMLHTLCPPAVRLLEEARPGATPASWALRFCASLPGVLTVLSGMSNQEQVRDNLATMSPLEPLSREEYGVLAQALDCFLQQGTIPCTGCRYCMDCPYGVDIPGVFAQFNACAVRGDLPVSLGEDPAEYRRRADAFLSALGQLPEEAGPQHCVGCNHCTDVHHCPQGIPIPRRLGDIRRMAGELAALPPL